MILEKPIYLNKKACLWKCKYITPKHLEDVQIDDGSETIPLFLDISDIYIYRQSIETGMVSIGEMIYVEPEKRELLVETRDFLYPKKFRVKEYITLSKEGVILLGDKYLRQEWIVQNIIESHQYFSPKDAFNVAHKEAKARIAKLKEDLDHEHDLLVNMVFAPEVNKYRQDALSKIQKQYNQAEDTIKNLDLEWFEYMGTKRDVQRAYEQIIEQYATNELFKNFIDDSKINLEVKSDD